MVDDVRIAESRECAALVGADVVPQHRHAAEVSLVDDRVWTRGRSADGRRPNRMTRR